MTVQSHLSNKASSAILSDAEKSSITTSIATLRLRLKAYFPTEMRSNFQFGSSTRGTILPRSMDERSDIDYMIVFKDEQSKPQTHVNRLRRFAQKYYSSSEIAQSHPTIVLKLNHIKFDLVPAINSYLDDEEYRIPAPASSYEDWTWTAPNDFNTRLSAANKNCSYMLKPSIRLVKYWNARAGYVYDSYELEKELANRHYFMCSTIRDYFFTCVDGLSLGWGAAKWKSDQVERAKRIVARTRELEAEGLPFSAEAEIQKLVP